MPGILLVFCEHGPEVYRGNKELSIINSSYIYFQASYETLYHSYLSTNKAESLDSSSSGPGEVDRTGEVMQAILQVETSKRACIVM